MSSAQIIQTNEFDPKRIIYSEMKEEIMKTANPSVPIKGQRISLAYRYSDGTTGPLIIPVVPNRFSFGVSENKDPANPDKVNGYTLPLVLFSKDGATVEEKEWVRFYEQTVVNSIKKELVDNKLTKYKNGKLNMDVLDTFGQLYRKKENNVPVADTDFQGPVFYPKLIENKKMGTITSLFMDDNDDVIEAKSLIGTMCRATVLVRIESIYVQGGGKYSLQVKVYQASISRTSSSIKPLLPPSKKSKPVVEEAMYYSSATNPLTEKEEEEEEEDEEPIKLAPPPVVVSVSAPKRVVKPRA
jgi:hypothetical protein